MSRDRKTDMEAPLPGYDVVIATRNRPEALMLSVPLLLSQTVPPEKLIVVDSSDDHDALRAHVLALTDGFSGPVEVIRADPGLPHQRNMGLNHVTAPVVVFPDDDSLLYPDAAEEMLKVYARDTEGRIAGVAAGEAMAPPPGALPEGSYRMSGTHDREAKTRLWRYYLSRRLTVLKPALKLGQVLNGQHPVPDWLAGMDAKPTEYMTGFRMSFRTEAIRASGFDETLGGYALDEDVDASLTAMRQGLVVGALRARIYHHRFPGSRSNGRRLGAMEVLNRLYVGLKHVHGPAFPIGETPAMRRSLKVFVLLKILGGLPGLHTSFGRARLGGALSAAFQSRSIWQATPDALATAYQCVMAGVVDGRKGDA